MLDPANPLEAGSQTVWNLMIGYAAEFVLAWAPFSALTSSPRHAPAAC